jgi:hypothetical protein
VSETYEKVELERNWFRNQRLADIETIRNLTIERDHIRENENKLSLMTESLEEEIAALRKVLCDAAQVGEIRFRTCVFSAQVADAIAAALAPPQPTKEQK